MPVTLEMPFEMEQRLREQNPNFDAEVREAVALDLFRKEKIGIYEFRLMLGLTRSEANAFLVDREEWAQSLTLEELESDLRNHEKMMAAKGL